MHLTFHTERLCCMYTNRQPALGCWQFNTNTNECYAYLVADCESGRQAGDPTTSTACTSKCLGRFSFLVTNNVLSFRDAPASPTTTASHL